MNTVCSISSLFPLPSSLFYLLSSLFYLTSSAQDTLPTKKLFIGACAHYGFIIEHHPNMDYLIKRHVPAGEFNFILQTNGEKRWEKSYKNPEKGVGIYFAALGNPAQLGQAIGIFPFVNFPLNPGRKFKLYFRSSNGIGIITKPYNRINNHKNNIIGSRINGFVNLRLSAVFFPRKHIRMETGIGLSHLSNGAWSVPNLGVNIATINMGIGFAPSLKGENPQSPPQADLGQTTAPFRAGAYFFTVIAAAAPNESNPPDGKKYAAFSLYASGWKTVSDKSRFCIGSDFFYEMANLAVAERDTIFDTRNKLNNLQAGLRLGYELVIGKFALPLEMGGYLFTKTTVNGPLYHRIGIRYYANKRLIVNYTLRTHWATAEHYEFGLGYRF